MRNTLCAASALIVALSVFPAAARAQTAEKQPSPPLAAPTIRETESVATEIGPLQRGVVMTQKVPSYSAASAEILDAVTSEGGMLSDTRSEVGEGGRRHGWMRLRVPANRLSALTVAVRSIGIPYAERMTTVDNSSEYESLALRAGRLREHEGRLSSVLSSEQRLRGSDILYVQERLFRASVDESLLLQDRSDFARQARTSALLIFLFEPTPTNTLSRVHIDASAQFAYARNRAADTLTKAARRVITGSAYAFVYAPLYLPVLALIGFVLYRMRRSIFAGLHAVVAALTFVRQSSLSMSRYALASARQWRESRAVMAAGHDKARSVAAETASDTENV